VVVEDNQLHHNNLVGIRIRGRTPVEIRRCRIYANGMVGIAVERDANVTVAGCEVFSNNKGGINVGENAPVSAGDVPKDRSNMARRRPLKSEEERTQVSQVTIAYNRIYMNHEGGIRSTPRYDKRIDLRVVGNEIYRNTKAGIRVENDTRLTAKRNHIYENGMMGIASLKSPIPPELDIYQNRINSNGGPGIHVINGLSGSTGIRNNWVHNNLHAGIACGLVDDPTDGLLKLEIVNNTIVSNGSHEHGAGIRNDSKGKVEIVNNIVVYNYVTGIMTNGCKDYSNNLLFQNGYVGNVSKDTDQQVDWHEASQYAGCVQSGKGDVFADPLFVDPDNCNFYLQDKSPAIDAGNQQSVFDDMSFPPSKGTKRNDMGATGGPYAID
jgi:hypothetical protein